MSLLDASRVEWFVSFACQVNGFLAGEYLYILNETKLSAIQAIYFTKDEPMDNPLALFSGVVESGRDSTDKLSLVWDFLNPFLEHAQELENLRNSTHVRL